MPFTINGIGSHWYGKALEEDDGSYVVTEWAVLIYAPLFPMGSYRVWPIENNKYKVRQVSWHIPHILKIYGIWFGVYLLVQILEMFGVR